MRSPHSTLTRKGQVTIPRDMRVSLGLKPKDRVLFELANGVVTLRPAPSGLLAGYGAVAPLRRPEDFRALREAFEEGVAADVVAETE